MKERSNVRETDFVRMFLNIEGSREASSHLYALTFELRPK